jgi:hypothetical protein
MEIIIILTYRPQTRNLLTGETHDKEYTDEVGECRAQSVKYKQHVLPHPYIRERNDK